MKAEEAAKITNEIFELYRKHGTQNYLGENVSQLEHMIQCAMLAEEKGYGDDVILGALFHDLGHLIGFEQRLEAMANGMGTIQHDIVGAEYLEKLGFPETFCQLLRYHVEAKRYLVYKKEGYHDQLSTNSKRSLVHQGGPMNEKEASEFEKLHNFQAIVSLREWDDLGKVKGKEVKPLDKYVKMCKNYLASCA